MPAADVLFEGELHVDYGFLHLQPEIADPLDLVAARGGQVNGLCGAAQPGVLALVTGLHTGDVPIRVEAHDGPPDLEPEWEEAVEVSLAAAGTAYLVSGFDEGEAVTLPGPGSYRVRFCATGMDAARDQDVRMDGEPAPDRYRLQLWPALPAPDAVLRSTSEIAAYWHGVARTTAPPPPAPTGAEPAAVRAAEEERARAARDLFHERQELRLWAGRPPGDRLRALGGQVPQLARVDRDLVDAIAALDTGRQRALAARAARHACTTAGVAGRDWVAAALDALDRGAPLPPPWDDPVAPYRRMFDGAELVVTVHRPPPPAPPAGPDPAAPRPAPLTHPAAPRPAPPTGPGAVDPGAGGVPSGVLPEPPPIAPEAAAVSAVLGAGTADPLRAALAAVDGAASAYADRREPAALVRAWLTGAA